MQKDDVAFLDDYMAGLTTFRETLQEHADENSLDLAVTIDNKGSITVSINDPYANERPEVVTSGPLLDSFIDNQATTLGTLAAYEVLSDYYKTVYSYLKKRDSESENDD